MLTFLLIGAGVLVGLLLFSSRQMEMPMPTKESADVVEPRVEEVVPMPPSNERPPVVREWPEGVGEGYPERRQDFPSTPGYHSTHVMRMVPPTVQIYPMPPVPPAPRYPARPEGGWTYPPNPYGNSATEHRDHDGHR